MRVGDRVRFCVLPVLAAMSVRLVMAAPGVTTSSRIPLCVGLTIVTSISSSEGDVESLKVIDRFDQTGIHLRYSAELPPEKLSNGAIRARSLRETRVISNADLRSATRYLQWYGTQIPIEASGTTGLGPSAAVLTALKSRGEAELGLFEVPIGTQKVSSDSKQHPNIFDYVENYKLKRVESGSVAVPMLVNGIKTELPTIHVTGRSEFYGYKAEFFFLDDESNPLALKFRIGIGSGTGLRAGGDQYSLKVTKIAFRCGGGSSAIERGLTDRGRVDVYDIYFAFNSDEIREESEPTLRDIADILRRHQDWKLSVGGHTDAIGGDQPNLDLSRRRADAVKNALVSSFGIPATRLMTSGYGRSRPVDTNDTEEGRARNRRVELARQ